MTNSTGEGGGIIDDIIFFKIGSEIMSEKNFPEISVIIPMYNSEKFIGECLDSVFAQTFQDFEIIVVDDCSTDKSCEIVENYVKNFGKKIKLIRRKKNSGSGGEPRNDGVKNSCGKYLFFLEPV